MTETRTISAAAARRFLAVRHFLAPSRALPAGPDGVMRVFERFGSIQFDPLEVAGRNHDLVLLARVAGYRRAVTDRLLYEDRRLFEAYNKGLSLLPVDELPWFRITWELFRNRAEHDGGAFVEHKALVEELLGRIRSDGPLSSTDVETRAAIDWYWRPTNQVRAILEALAQAGILGLHRREGNRRVYDLIERLYPPDVLAERHPERDQRRHRLLSRYRAHGLLGRGGNAELWLGTAPGKSGTHGVTITRRELHAELVERGELVRVDVESLKGERYVVASELPLLDAVVGGSAPFEPGVAFIAPLDPLAWDRELLRQLYAFDYLWEVYVPAAKRRWGYYVLPVHWGDRFVGRIEPRIDRSTGTLRILGLWWEDGFDPLAEPGFVEAFGAAVEAHRGFAGSKRIAFPRAVRHRAFSAAVRDRLGNGAMPEGTAA